MFTMPTQVAIWCGLLLVVLVLLAIRRWLSRAEDDTLHLGESELKIVQRQSSVARILNRVDRWGKVLTVVVVLYGVVLVGQVVYFGWLDSMRLQ